MAIEIERKFLVRDESWRQGVRGWWFIKQGYFARTALLRARVRIFGDKGFVTFKSEPGTRVRYEFEYEIPHADALEIIRRFSIEPLIVKTRHEILYADKLWWVDVFAGANQGLLVAEVELNHPDESLSIPEWIKQRLDDPSRHWKISETDYSERELWPQYMEAYEDAVALTSTKHAPWYIIPANHKWFRNLAVSQIIADTMNEMGLQLPATQVAIAEMRRKYHAAEREEKVGGRRQENNANKID